MPKYRNKQNLKRIIARGNKLNTLTRHLILQGSSYEEAIEGLERYVSDWEQSVKYIQKMSVNDSGYSEEYDHDLWARSELYEVLKYASAEEICHYRDRIFKADLAFKDCTIESNLPNNHIENPNKLEHWWLFRVNNS